LLLIFGNGLLIGIYFLIKLFAKKQKPASLNKSGGVHIIKKLVIIFMLSLILALFVLWVAFAIFLVKLESRPHNIKYNLKHSSTTTIIRKNKKLDEL